MKVKCTYFQDNTGTLEVLKAALKDSGDLPFKERLKHLRSTFLTHREMGECESYYRLLPSLHLVGSNIRKVFVPTGLNKSRLIKKISDEEGMRRKDAMKINEKGQEGYYIETKNILEKYHGRPDSLRWISGMQFVKRYCDIGVHKKLENEEGEEDIEMIEDADLNNIENDFIIALEPHKRDRLPSSVVCEVDGKNYYMKRRKPQVIRLHKWKMETESHQYFFAELELYHVLSIEELKECHRSLDKCLEVYNENIEKINYVRNKTMPFMKHVEDAMEKAEIVANIDDIENALDAEGAQDNADCGSILMKLRKQMVLLPMILRTFLKTLQILIQIQTTSSNELRLMTMKHFELRPEVWMLTSCSLWRKSLITVRSIDVLELTTMRFHLHYFGRLSVVLGPASHS